ncbi:MAG: hypothetical protein V2B20_07375 [Pseudomonadota bacterium]
MRNSVLPLMVLISVFMSGPYLTVSLAQPTPQVAIEQSSAAASSAQQVVTKDVAKSAEMVASVATNPQWQPPSDWLLYGVPIIVLFGSFVTVLVIRKALPAEWSLADALSEDVQMPVIKEVTTPGHSRQANYLTI